MAEDNLLHPPYEIRDRFFRLMPESEDITLLVLKGHLLLEEQLRAFLEAACPAPRFLRDARLSYYQCLLLFQAMAGVKDSDPYVVFLRALNEVRNHLSHNAEVEDLAERVDALIKLLANSDEVRASLEPGRPTGLSSACVRALGWLSAWLTIMKAAAPDRHLVLLAHSGRVASPSVES